MKLKEKQIVDSINLSDVKKGDIIKIKDDDKCYIVMKHHQWIKLVPINLKEIKQFEDASEFIIETIYDGFSGNVKQVIKDKVN